MVQDLAVKLLIKGALFRQTIKHLRCQIHGGMGIIQQGDSYLWVLSVHTY